MSRPVALMVMTRMPWPLDDGGRLGFWQALWSLSIEFDVLLVVLTAPEDMDAPVPEAVRARAAEVIRVAHRPPPLAVAAVAGLFGRWPFTITRWRNAELDRRIRRLVAERRPELVVLSSLHVGTYVDACAGVPVVLRDQNAEYLWMERYATELRGLAKVYARLQAWRLRGAEAELCRRADEVVAVTDLERRLLQQLAPSASVSTVPLGLDLARFPARAPDPAPTVLIVGSFEWAPNVTGVERFLAEGWPVLRERAPAARLRIAGKKPPESLRALAEHSGAELLGYVESMEAEFARATLLLVPLWVGAGARFKIVEAAAAGLPVVSTTLGAEGLALRPGEEYAQADTPATLAEAAADLLADAARRTTLAANARRAVEAHYSLDAVAAHTLSICRGVIQRRRDRGGRS